MEERSRRTIFGLTLALRGGRFRLRRADTPVPARWPPSALYSSGAGSATWAAGEGFDRAAHPSTARALTDGGFVAVAVGLAAVVAAGDGWPPRSPAKPIPTAPKRRPAARSLPPPAASPTSSASPAGRGGAPIERPVLTRPRPHLRRTDRVERSAAWLRGAHRGRVSGNPLRVPNLTSHRARRCPARPSRLHFRGAPAQTIRRGRPCCRRQRRWRRRAAAFFPVPSGRPEARAARSSGADAPSCG